MKMVVIEDNVESLQNDKQRLNEFINSIRMFFPSNAKERVLYIKRFKECNLLIDRIMTSEPEYFNRNLIVSRKDRVEYIIGWKFHQSASTHKVNKVKQACDNKCAVCDFHIKETLNAHHIIPRYLGGKNDESNLIALCPTCHKIFHIIEDEQQMSDEIYNYLKDSGYIFTVLEYTYHLLNDNYS